MGRNRVLGETNLGGAKGEGEREATRLTPFQNVHDWSSDLAYGVDWAGAAYSWPMRVSELTSEDLDVLFCESCDLEDGREPTDAELAAIEEAELSGRELDVFEGCEVESRFGRESRG